MATPTPREQRQRALRIGFVAGGLAFASALAFAVARADPHAKDALVRLAHNSTVHVVVVALGLAILVIREILDNADQLRLLREIFYRVLGYEPEEMESRNRDFARIPPTYEHREELERALVKELAAGMAATGPRLIVLSGEGDSGKTTLINYVVSRFILKRYRSRVLLCRSDRQSLKLGPGDTEEQIREKLVDRIFTRTIQQTKVPGHISDSLEGKQEEISGHFHEERKPWLVVVDQIEDAQFPYARVLPALYGARNTVLVACRYPTAIPESALHPLRPHHELSADTADSADGTAERIDIPMRPFTLPQALRLLKAELRRRHVRPDPSILEELRQHLQGKKVFPGFIQHLSDDLRGLGRGPGSRERLSELRATLGPVDNAVVNDEVRVRKLVALTVNRFKDAEPSYLAALSVLRRDSISGGLLRYLEWRIGPEASDGTPLLRWCIERGYVKEDDDEGHVGAAAAYRVSKLGQGMARAARSRMGVDGELRAGTAILDYYRAVSEGREPRIEAPTRHLIRGISPVRSVRRATATAREGTTVDLLTELPNLLQAMAWSQIPPRTMPQSDVIAFARLLRHAFYHSGEWRAGEQWLDYATRLAREDDLPCSLGDLESATAHLLLGRGLPRLARQRIDAARSAYQQSEERARADIRLQLAPRHRALLEDSVHYNLLQIQWLAHLDVQASLALLPTAPALAALENIAASLREAQVALRAHIQDTRNRYQTLGRSIALALLLDEGDLALRLGDAFARDGDTARARTYWRHARQIATTVRRRAPTAGRLTGTESMARAYRLEGAALRRHARYAPFLLRPLWRRAAFHYLQRGLRYCRRIPSRYEQALTLHQSALVAIASPSTDHRLGSTIGEQAGRSLWLRSAAARLRPRWHRLHAALRQLRAASAAAAAMGADDVHARILVTLAQSSLLAWHLDHDAAHHAAAREYAASVRSIVSRLRERAPELEGYLDALPDELRAAPPPPTALPASARAGELVAARR